MQVSILSNIIKYTYINSIFLGEYNEKNAKKYFASFFKTDTGSNYILLINDISQAGI